MMCGNVSPTPVSLQAAATGATVLAQLEEVRIRRRQFTHHLGALFWLTPFSAFGQSKDKPTVGVLGYASEAVSRPYVEGLRDGLGKYGLIAGSTMRLVEILRGADPSQLPIEQATAYQVVVNLKTARILGLTLSPSLLARADEVIE